MPAADDKTGLRPDDLRPHLEPTGLEALGDESGLGTGMPNVGYISGEQHPRLPPVGAVTRLVREWKGITHEVTVVEGGFEYQGRRYRSLSAAARAIAGTRWNGPLFFGLRNHQAERAGQ